MLIYILKSTGILALLLLFYKLILEQERIHVLKRFFLLSSIIIAIVIPSITFITYVETTTIQESAVLNLPNQVVEETITTNYFEIILWSLYSLGALFFGIRFLINLSKLLIKVRKNEKIKTSGFIYVLINELALPHTFFRYIFFEKKLYEANKIPNEVKIHEEAHASQFHSVDILFIELLQVIFWFNPFIYLLKNSVKLNHEFLADAAVLKSGSKLDNYQNILLEYSTNHTIYPMANAIHYSSIKKRFTIMKTKTSLRQSWLKGILILPLLTILVYGFGEKQVIEQESASKHLTKKEGEKIFNSEDTIDKETYFKNVTFRLRDKNKKIYATKKYSELDERIKSSLAPMLTPSKKTISREQINEWRNEKKYSIWIDNKRIENNNLGNFDPKDFDLYYVTKLEKNAKDYGKYMYQVDLVSKEVYNKVYKDGVKPLKEGTIWEIHSYDYISDQDKATAAQVAEYNKLAKHYNAQDPKKMIVKAKDVERLDYLYRLMTKEQKKTAEPFPSFPPPPPPPPPHGISKDKIKRGSKELQVLAAEFDKRAKRYGIAIKKYYETKENYKELKPLYDELMVAFGKLSKKAADEQTSIPPPPPPIPEKSEKKNKGGQKTADILNDIPQNEITSIEPDFYINGKKVSREKVKSLNKDLIESIEVKKKKGTNGSVYITLK